MLLLLITNRVEPEQLGPVVIVVFVVVVVVVVYFQDSGSFFGRVEDVNANQPSKDFLGHRFLPVSLYLSAMAQYYYCPRGRSHDSLNDPSNPVSIPFPSLGILETLGQQEHEPHNTAQSLPTTTEMFLTHWIYRSNIMHTNIGIPKRSSGIYAPTIGQTRYPGGQHPCVDGAQTNWNSSTHTKRILQSP